jgi:hypothetical protein
MATLSEDTKEFLVRISGGIRVALTGEAYSEYGNKAEQLAKYEASRTAPPTSKYDTFAIDNWLEQARGREFKIFSSSLFEESLGDDGNHAGIQNALIYLEKNFSECESEFFDLCVLESYYDLFDHAAEKGHSRLHLQLQARDHIDTFAKFFGYAQRRDLRVQKYHERIAERDARELALDPEYVAPEPRITWIDTPIYGEPSVQIQLEEL